MGKLVTALALTVLVLGAALYTFGEVILPAAGEAGRSTAAQIEASF
ncbi:hypothetical protein [Paenibacillus sp.]|nr:hypothetical protein [Paenibacillus sp.]HZG86139.1 hypothetical protein [Paenibacillus sp.]